MEEFILLILAMLSADEGLGLQQQQHRQRHGRGQQIMRLRMVNDDAAVVGLHLQFLYFVHLFAFNLMRLHNEQEQRPRIRRFGHVFRSDAWWTIDVENVTNRRWIENVRMSRPSFNLLCDRLNDSIMRKENKFGRNLTSRKCVAMTLYRLATCCDLRTIANLFGVARSTVCVVVHQVCQAIVQVLRNDYIVWPQGQRLEETINGFRQKHGFPQCAGAIDGSHIPIIAPNKYPSDYYNRKGWHSIVLQAVADHKLRFTDVYVGWPGKVHDARILRNSTLFERGNEGELFPRWTENIHDVQVPVMLLGDPAYPLLKWLMKGFPVTENIAREHTLFNYRLSKAKMVVERSFGMLKGRWRILMKRNDSALRHVSQMVVACCILHNFCIDEGEIYNQEWDVADEHYQQPHVEDAIIGQL